MRALFPLLALAATLSACATPIPPVEVTRFHRIDAAHAISPGSVRVSVSDGSGAASPSLIDASYAAAVSQQLTALGLRSESASAAPVDYVATVVIDRATRTADQAGNGVSVGVGGSTGSYGSGLGVGVGLDLTRLFSGGTREVVTTRMAVRLTRSGDALPLWEGRAETAARAGTPAAQPGLDADKLARALFASFPGQSGQTVRVP